MELIKLMFRRIGIGFLYGCGFMLGVSVISNFVLTNQMGAPGATVISESVGTKVEGLIRKAEIVDSKVIDSGHSLTFIGTVKNPGESSIEFVVVVVDLFSAEAEFLYQCKDYIAESILGGASTNFQVECRGLTPEIKNSYDNFKIKITR